MKHNCIYSALLALVIASPLQAQQPPELGGTWQVSQYHTGIRTLDGSLPPFTTTGKAQYELNLQERRSMKPRNDMTRCVPSGTPRAMFAPQPMMILQTARKVSIIQEYQHQLRHIYMDEPLPSLEDVDLSFMGESAGHWEGDTLVVETYALKPQTVLDREGLPKTSDMRITERLRLVNGGLQLEDVLTFDDPAFYSSPWSTRVVYDRKTGVQLKEYNCLDHYEDL